MSVSQETPTMQVPPPLQAYRDLLYLWSERAIDSQFEERHTSRSSARMAMIRILRDFAYHARAVLAGRFTHVNVSDEDDRTMIRVTDNFQGVSCSFYSDYDAMQWREKQEEVFPV